MAQTYSNTPVLSKIQLPGVNTPYYLKDADARAILDTLKSAAFLDADTNITEGAEGVAKTSAIKAYVDSAIKIGVTVVKVETLPAASASTEGKIYIVPQSQGKTDDNFDEYITIDNGTSAQTRYTWEKIGDTRIDLSGYVTDVSYADGTHTLSQTKNGATTTVHTFGVLADKSSVAVQYDKATSGEVEVNIPTQAHFTGEEKKLNFEVKTDGSNLVTDISPTVKYLELDTNGTEGSYKTSVVPSYTPTKETVTVTAKGGQEGTAASLGAQATATFAQTGIVASVGTGVDAETLIFATASTATAVTPGLYTNFSSGTPTTLPTAYATGEVVTGITGATAVEVLNNVDLTVEDNSGSGAKFVQSVYVSGSTNTLTGSLTYQPAGSITFTTTTVTATVDIDTTPTAATVDIQ